MHIEDAIQQADALAGRAIAIVAEPDVHLTPEARDAEVKILARYAGLLRSALIGARVEATAGGAT